MKLRESLIKLLQFAEQNIAGMPPSVMQASRHLSQWIEHGWFPDEWVWSAERPQEEYGRYWVRDKHGHVFVGELMDGVICNGDWCERSEEPGYLVAFAGPIRRPIEQHI